MIFFAASGGGFFASVQLERRKRQLGGFKRSLLFLRREIDYALAPLPEAFSHTADRVEEPWKQFWKGAAEELQKGKKSRVDFFTYWERQVQNIKRFHPWQKDWELFYRMGKGLGQMDKEMQLSQLQMLEKEMESREEEAGEECRKKAHLYRVLGACLGGLGVILLL
jgi:stage III sporulation protein AB